MLAPEPANYYAQWVDSQGGARKASRNLWIFERATGRKRYSVTTDAGAKIQPYFDVPPPNDPHVYLFTVIGEHIDSGKVRVWLTPATAREIARLVGSLDADAISDMILKAVQEIHTHPPAERVIEEAGVFITIREDAYRALISTIPGVSDEHCFQLLSEHLRLS